MLFLEQREGRENPVHGHLKRAADRLINIAEQGAKSNFENGE